MRLNSKDMPHVWLMSLVAGLSAYRFFFVRLAQTPLSHFDDRVIGLPVILGIDAALRTRYYVAALCASVVVFVLSHLMLRWLDRHVRNRVPQRFVQTEYDLIAMLGGFVVFSAAISLLVGNPIISGSAPLLLSFALFLGGLVLFKSILWKRHKRLVELYSCYPLIGLALGLPFSAISLFWVFVEGQCMVSPLHWAVYWLLVLVLLLLCPLAVKYRHTARDRIVRATVLAGAGLLCIPLTLPVAQEMHYRLPEGLSASPRMIAAVLCGLLVLVSGIFYQVVLRTDCFRCVDVRKFANAVFFPLVLASICLVTLFQHNVLLGSVDLLHHGQARLIAHQFFRFDLLPFVDIMPVHGLVDLFTHATPRWIPTALSGLLVFLTVAVVASPAFAFLIVVATPTAILAYPMFHHSCFCLVPFLVLHRILKTQSPSVPLYALLWLSTAGGMLWRYDVGCAALVAVVVVLAGDALVRHGPRAGLARLVHPTGTSCGAVTVSLLLIYSVVGAVKGYRPLAQVPQYCRD